MIQRLRYLTLALVLVVSLLATSQLATATPTHSNQSQQGIPGGGISLEQATGLKTAPVPLMYDPNPIPNRVEPISPAGLSPQSANFVIDYVPAGTTSALGDTCLAFPPEAAASFNDSGAKWAALLNSPVPVRIEACWADMPQYVLGHSSALDYWRDFPGAPQASTYFPVALANSLAGQDLSPDTDCTGSGYPASNCDDISITYANGYYSSFYFGTDGNPGNKIDFESVVMHEMGHGLGFAGSLYVSGSYGYQRYTYPFIFDRFAIDNNAVSLLNTGVYPSGGTALGSVLTNGPVYLNDTNARAANGNAPVPLYTPGSWQGGSSYSHLAESYNGTVNAMMTYSIGNGEVQHDPGPVVMGYLKDAGWVLPSSTPAAPSNLNASVVSTSQINLTWTDNSSNETLFNIQRAGSDLVWATVGTAPAVASIGGTGSFSSTGLVDGTQYNYRVCASNGSVCSDYSNIANAITTMAAPTLLSATVVSASQINLSWTDNSRSESLFYVQWAGSDMIWYNLGTAAAAPGTGGSVSYPSGGLTEGTQYNFRVCASNATTYSTFSNTAGATTRLAAPVSLIATVVSTSQINLTWTDNSAHEGSFYVQRAGNDLNWANVGTAAALPGSGGTGNYSSSGLTEGTQYNFRVCAWDGAHCSDFTNTASAVTRLATPTGVNGTAPDAAHVNLTWTNPSTHATGFTIYRSPNPASDASFAQIGTSTGASYTDSTAAADTFYHYHVRATSSNPVTTSDLSVWNDVKTPAATPTNLSAVGISTFQILVTWTDQSASETSFKVKRSLDGVTGWVDMPDVPASPGTGAKPGFIDGGLTEGNHFFYSVCAMGTYACSAQVVVQGASMLADPTGISATTVAWNRIDVSWTDNSANETGYEIQRSYNGVDGWTTVGTYTVGAGATTGLRTFQDTSGASLTVHYRVRAVTSLTSSNWLSGASAIPLQSPLIFFVPWTLR